MFDKLDDVSVHPDGTVTHNILKVKIKFMDGKQQVIKNTKTPRTWESFEKFRKWRNNILVKRRDVLQETLTPLQFYVTQGIGYERPFTGDNWWTKDVGMYSCVVCTQKLFMSDHKYPSSSGYPTFWHHIRDSIEMKTDDLSRPTYSNAHEDPLLKNKVPTRRCICSHCESHLGHIYEDGPLPFNTRYMINSASLTFEPKPWFEVPALNKEQIARIRHSQKSSVQHQKPFKTLLLEEKIFRLPKYENRVRRDNFVRNRK